MLGHNIRMVDEKGEEFKLEKRHNAGGTTEVGGNKTTWISVTYNYAWFFYRFFDKEKGIKWLYGKKGKDCKKKIRKMIGELMTPKCFGNGEIPYKRDYWAPTPGNVKKVLDVIAEWCDKFPNGLFEGD